MDSFLPKLAETDKNLQKLTHTVKNWHKESYLNREKTDHGYHNLHKKKIIIWEKIYQKCTDIINKDKKYAKMICITKTA